MESIKESVRALPEQFQDAWDVVQLLPIPQQFYDADSIVVAGMGGSALGGRMIKHYAKSQLPVPVDLVTDYDLPEYVNERTLVIVASYSGETEETLNALQQALERDAMIFVITTGGKLMEIAKAEGISSYFIDPVHNPSKQPRMATGYMVGAMFSLFALMRFINFSEGELDAALAVMRDHLNRFENEESEPKQLAQKLNGKIPVLVASEHLLGPAHVFKNQLNETAKSFSVLFDVPELNHHLMEGLAHPEADKKLLFVLFSSSLYQERVQKRFDITKEVVEKNNIEVFEYNCKSETKFQQVLEVLAFGSFAQLYLAELYGSDPISVPWVDYFKQKLS